VRIDRFLWLCVILAILLLCGYELAHCQIVPASEIRMTAGTPRTIPGRYHIVISSVTGHITCTTPAGADCSPTASSIAWGAITGVPTTFAPSAHNHSAGDINAGILGVLYGGTGWNGVPADVILVGTALGGAYDQKTLCTGYVKYSLTTHLFTCDAGTGATFTGGTLTSKLNLTPSTLTGAGINLGAGSVTPTSGLVTGDLWGDNNWELNWWNGVAQYTAERRDHKGQPNGYAGLDGAGLVPTANLPAGSTGVNVTGNAQQYTGFCTGTTASSATLSIPPFGTANASSCSSTTNTNELPMSWSGTLRNLQVKAGTAGRLSTSGVVTLYKNGVATGITCTLGTGTICSDVTHTSAVNVGDTVGVRITTQSTETLANVRVTFEDYGGGTGFNYRGAWTASTIYNPYDVVTNGGTTYERSGPTFTSGATFNAANWNIWALGSAAAGVPAGGTTGQVLTKNSNSDYDTGWATGGGGGGSGTVTSVALSAPAQFTVAGSPITSAGTLALSWATQTANLVFAGPTTGSAAVPGFRSLVVADIPTLNQNTTGTAANVTGTVAIGNGGTGQTGKTAAFNALSPLTTLGDIPYHDGTDVVRLAGNTTTTRKFLRQTGTGTVSAAMVWDTILSGDIPNNAANTTGTAAGLSGSQTANFVYAAPSGSAGTATFRALVALDIPTLNQNTTGTSANVTGVVAEANGGTGSNITPGAAGHYLRSNGTHYVDNTIQAADVPTLNQATTGNAATATALAANGTNCSAVNAPLGVDASGSAESCFAVSTPDSTDTFTNKTLDAEAGGNLLKFPILIVLQTAGCNNATAGTAFDLPTASAAAAACFGTTTTQGALNYVDAATTTATTHFTIPNDWAGTGSNVDIDLYWFANLASANAVRWSVAVGCIADSEAISTGPTYNTASAGATAYTGTANQRKTSSFTGVTTTGCATNETMYLQVQRIGADASDTLAATASLLEVRIKMRRSI
jgi:hypothetical protein